MYKENQNNGNSYLNGSLEQSLEPMMPDPILRLNEDKITDNRVMRKQEWKTYAEAAQEGSFEDQSEEITSNFGKSESGK